MLTQNQLNSLPWEYVSINDSTIIANHQVLEVDGVFYTAHGNRIFPNDYNQNTRRYILQGVHILHASPSNVLARMQPADIVKSWVNDFDGFAFGKTFNLDNGQVWQQVDYQNSSCSPGGQVWILNQEVMRVGNWNFDIAVKRVQ